MSIYVCGDIHGGADGYKLYSHVWSERDNLTKDDFLIVLGDLGLIWALQEDVREQRQANFLFSLPCQVCFLDGNHENFDRLDKFEITEKWGGKVQIVKSRGSKHIYRLRRGEVYTIDGKKIFTLGGGLSVDKDQRKPHITWWPQEAITDEDLDNGHDNLVKHDYKVDYVLTHNCPRMAMKELCKDAPNIYYKLVDPALDIMDEFENMIEYKEWHFGHYHVDENNGVFFAHFNDDPYKLGD